MTRTRERASGLVDALHDRGAEAVIVPLIATQPLASPDEIAAQAAALAAAPAPRWIAFTSATAVRLTLGVAGPKWLEDVHVAAVGSETAGALLAYGVRADVTGAGDGAALAVELGRFGLRGATVWFPGAEAAGPGFLERLREAGAEVAVQSVYRTVMPGDAPRRLAVALDAGIDAVTLTSGSTARNLVRALGARPLPPGTIVVCIGAQTAHAARGAGLDVTAVAGEPTALGMIAALESLG